VKPEVPCRKILRHVKELLKSHGDEYTKFSFLSPISYCFRGVSGDGQSALVVKLGVSPSRSRLLIGTHRYQRGIVQQAQGSSSDTAVSPHHNNQSSHWIGGWVDFRAGLGTEDRGKILCLCLRSKPDRSVRSQAVKGLILTELPRLTDQHVNNINSNIMF
jgi:ribosome modulation factor